MLGEYFAAGNPGGDLLGDWRLEDSSVAKVGGDVGGYPTLSKILRSGDCFACDAIAAFIAILLASKVAGNGEEISCSLAGVDEGVEDLELEGETSELLDVFFLIFFWGVAGSSSLVFIASWSCLLGDVKS